MAVELSWAEAFGRMQAVGFSTVQGWDERLGAEDRRALSPLFWSHIDPYGRFRLDMDTRLDLPGTSH